MKRIRSENENTLAEWDGIYGSANAARWTIWHDPHLVGLFVDRIPKAPLSGLASVDDLTTRPTVLDAGCGNGWAPKYIAAERPDILWTGADFSPAAVVYLASLDFRWQSLFRMDLNELPLSPATASFDTVMCTEVLEHLEDPRATVQELLRIARKFVAVTIPRENATDTKYHVWSLDEDDLREWFAGYKVEIVPARLDKILCCFAWKP